MTKTDNQAEVGTHVFERSGLGKGPFRCVGMYEKTFQASPSAPAQPGGTCAYCSNGILYCYVIRSADKKEFVVGSDCVARTGDVGLIKSYKARPELRALNRAKAKALDERKTAEWAAIIADEAKLAVLNTYTFTTFKGEQPWGETAQRIWKNCGASGRARYLKTAKALLADAAAKVAQ